MNQNKGYVAPARQHSFSAVSPNSGLALGTSTNITTSTGAVSVASTPGRASRIVAGISGAAIVGASAYAVIHAAHMDTPHAVLTGALAIGVLAGAATVGRAWTARRHALALAIGAALVCGEGFGLLTTADRIATERERAQADVRSQLGAHMSAVGERTAAQLKFDAALKSAQSRKAADVAKAQAAHNDAVQAKLSQAALPGCKDRCVALLTSAEASAKAALDAARSAQEADPIQTDAVVTAARADLMTARQKADANPKPEQSASALADRLGWSPFVVDMLFAGLLSIAANGLGAALFAFGAHGHAATRDKRSEQKASVDSATIDPGVNGSTANKVTAFLPGPGGGVHTADDVNNGGERSDGKRPSGGLLVGDDAVNAVGLDTTRAKVLALITEAGGSVHGTQRGLARRVGVSASRLNVLLSQMQADGAVKVRTSSTGTVLQMA